MPQEKHIKHLPNKKSHHVVEKSSGPKRPGMVTFLLYLTNDHDNIPINWPLVLQEVQEWGEKQDDLLQVIAGLHRRLYDLSVNLELSCTLPETE